MKAHTEEEFELFLSQLQETNQTLDFFCDFEKINQRVIDIKLSLCILNSLIGTKDLRQAVETIWRRDKMAFSVMGILIAVRDKDDKKILNMENHSVSVRSLFKSVDGVMEFLQGTGLAKMFQSQKIKDLVDYVFGVETGLDSNARKNRSGKLMERKVSELLKDAGIPFRTQVSSTEWEKLQAALGEDSKVFDFAFTSKAVTYLCEVNFYNAGGSKPNEVARAYTDLAPKINGVEGFSFVWVTDGKGWLSAKNKLQEAYYAIPNVYNLTNVVSFLRQF